MNQRSRSTLFLIEQLIVVAVFAICSAACVRILTSAYLTVRESKDVMNAVSVAQSGAESYKAFAGDVGKVAELLGGVTNKTDSISEATIYYDRQWQVCGKDSAFYVFHLMNGDPEALSASPVIGDILVEKLTGESLVAFKVAAGNRGLES
jgi:type II secretory pathway pseudopilin PulG